jgi:hypothetical protein
MYFSARAYLASVTQPPPPRTPVEPTTTAHVFFSIRVHSHRTNAHVELEVMHKRAAAPHRGARCAVTVLAAVAQRSAAALKVTEQRRRAQRQARCTTARTVRRRSPRCGHRASANQSPPSGADTRRAAHAADVAREQEPARRRGAGARAAAPLE